MINYDKYQEEKFKKWEDACKCCGACCGTVDGDPCLHLIKQNNGKHFCEIYNARLGMRKTRSGKIFRCVEIRDIINKHWPGSNNCVYKII